MTAPTPGDDREALRVERDALKEALERLVKAPGYNSASENYAASQHARRILASLSSQEGSDRSA